MINEKVFEFFNNFISANPFLNQLIIFLSDGFGYLLIAISFLYLFLHNDKKDEEGNSIKNTVAGIRQRIKELLVVYGSTFFAWMFVFIVKDLFANPRPFLVNPSIQTLFYYGGQESFPSGHAAFYGALAVSIFAYHRKTGIFFAVGAIIIGISRIIAGVHYPLDIVMGYVFGASVSVLVYTTIRFLSKRYKKYIDFFFNSV